MTGRSADGVNTAVDVIVKRLKGGNPDVKLKVGSRWGCGCCCSCAVFTALPAARAGTVRHLHSAPHPNLQIRNLAAAATDAAPGEAHEPEGQLRVQAGHVSAVRRGARAGHLPLRSRSVPWRPGVEARAGDGAAGAGRTACSAAGAAARQPAARPHPGLWQRERQRRLCWWELQQRRRWRWCCPQRHGGVRQRVVPRLRRRPRRQRCWRQRQLEHRRGRAWFAGHWCEVPQ